MMGRKQVNFAYSVDQTVGYCKIEVVLEVTVPARDSKYRCVTICCGDSVLRTHRGLEKARDEGMTICPTCLLKHNTAAKVARRNAPPADPVQAAGWVWPALGPMGFRNVVLPDGGPDDHRQGARL